MRDGEDAVGRVRPPPAVPEGAIELRYRPRAIRADLARAAGGLALAAAPLVAASPPAPVAVGLLGLAGLFAAFLAQTWRRGRSAVRLSDEGIALVQPQGSRRLAWRDVDRLRLRWFGPRRPGSGWLDLELGAAAVGGRPGERLAVTSDLQGFDLVLERAALAAESNRVELEPLSRANLAAAREEGRVKGRAGSSGPRG